MSEIITKINPDAIIDGNRIAPRTGSFEVELNGEIIFSKLQSGQFPSETEIESWL